MWGRRDSSVKLLFSLYLLLHKQQHLRRGNIQCLGKLKDGDQRGLFLAAFEKGYETPIKGAQIGKFFLRKAVSLSEIFNDLAKCFFDCQIRPLLKGNLTKSEKTYC